MNMLLPHGMIAGAHVVHIGRGHVRDGALYAPSAPKVTTSESVVVALLDTERIDKHIDVAVRADLDVLDRRDAHVFRCRERLHKNIGACHRVASAWIAPHLALAIHAIALTTR